LTLLYINRCAFLCTGHAVSGGIDAGGCGGGVPQRQNRCNIDAVTAPPRSTAGDLQRAADVDRRPPPLDAADDRPSRQLVGDVDGGLSIGRAPSRTSPAAR